jgi:hypothetical protein
LFTATGFPDDPLSPPVDDAVADALGVLVAPVALVVGADAVCDGDDASSEFPESLLHAVSSALPAITAATTGRQV